ncbi:hypothetical protein [Comamonas sp. A7-5]|uniref:hypothetical protein n=1 Tax=Comamonas sp. A7-5 TaxID=673549 RepID=UPI0031D4AA6D
MSNKDDGFIYSSPREGMSINPAHILDVSHFLAMGKMIAGPQTVTIEQLVERQAEAARKQREEDGEA